MIDLENRFRHPNQSTPKSMDAVFVRTIGVHENVQCCWVRCMHVAQKYTFLFPAPTQLKKYGQHRSFSFLENDASRRTIASWEWRIVFSPPKSNHTHSHPDPSSLFFDQKHVGKKTRQYIVHQKNDPSHENDWPTENANSSWERWADWNTHWWCPKTRNPAGGTFLLEDTPLAMQSNAKINQCVETTLQWNWPISKCVLKELLTKASMPYAAVSLLPHDAAASPSKIF